MDNIRRMQIGVPWDHYGACSYFLPKPLGDWAASKNYQYSYCSLMTSGDGYTDGRPNSVSTYIIHGAEEEDAVVFKLLFPECRVFVITPTINKSKDLGSYLGAIQ